MRATEITEIAEACLWRNVEKTDTCWLWRGKCVNNKGYAAITMRRRGYGIHRLSYALAFGEVPDDLFVLHRCDTPLCVNPEHLFLGTQADNIADCKQKGRLRPPLVGYGTSSPHSKLSEVMARNIVSLNAAGFSSPVLGRMFGVSHNAIRDVLHGVRWNAGDRFKRGPMPYWLKLHHIQAKAGDRNGGGDK